MSGDYDSPEQRMADRLYGDEGRCGVVKDTCHCELADDHAGDHRCRHGYWLAPTGEAKTNE